MRKSAHCSRIVVLALALAMVCGIAGCGSGKPEIDKKAEAIQVDAAKRARELFVKVNGNWDALSAEEKAEMTKLYNNEAHAKNIWNLMANPPSDRGVSR